MAQLRKHPFHGGAAAIADPGPRPPSLKVVQTPPQADGAVPSLTRRERECLAWCAEGKSYWETAVILGIAERTVSFHMEAMRCKLNAGSNAHAVAIGLRAGLLEATSNAGPRSASKSRGLR